MLTAKLSSTEGRERDRERQELQVSLMTDAIEVERCNYHVALVTRKNLFEHLEGLEKRKEETERERKRNRERAGCRFACRKKKKKKKRIR